MDLDIIIYAVVAVILLARLWTVFGRRNDEDKERPNPFAAPLQPPRDETPAQGAVPGNAPVALPPLLQPFRAAPASLAGGLEQAKALDANFDEKQFLQGARQAFTMIVEDFSKGDLSRITRLLGPDVLPHFRASIDACVAAGQVMESKINNIREAETAAAKVDGTTITITVRFVSEQENVLRDASGHVIGGEVGRVEEITDLWTFARDTTSSDPNWILVETGN
jgi:predicted lipid-binding transport protein (Tim44 family)